MKTKKKFIYTVENRNSTFTENKRKFLNVCRYLHYLPKT